MYGVPLRGAHVGVRVNLPRLLVRGIERGADRARRRRDGRELALEAREGPLAVEAVAQEAHVLVDGLRRERPHERDVIEARAGDVAVVRAPRRVGQDRLHAFGARALLRVVHGCEGRLHRLPVVALQAIGEHDGVLALLLERHDRTEDERVALALVPGDDVLDARVLAGRPEHVGMIDDAVEVGVEVGAIGAARKPGALLDASRR